MFMFCLFSTLLFIFYRLKVIIPCLMNPRRPYLHISLHFFGLTPSSLPISLITPNILRSSIPLVDPKLL